MIEQTDDATFRRQLDRLVDGELNAESYRELLASLEDRVDGWRDCALAFLESQAFAMSLGDVVAPKPPAPKHVTRETGSTYSWIGVMAVVASLFVGLGIGAITVGALKFDWRSSEDRSPNDAPMIADGSESPNSEDSPVIVTPEAIVENGATSLPTDTHQTIYHTGAPQLRGDLRMQVDGEELLLPVYDAEGYDPKWLENPPTGVPSTYVQQLRSRGHQVQHRRALATFPLDNGDLVVAPVEQLQVTPVNLEWQ